MKYVDLVKYCLGIIFQTENGIIAMTQQTYNRELLDCFGMTKDIAHRQTSLLWIGWKFNVSFNFHKTQHC